MATKDELKAELDRRGIEYDPDALKDDLAELLSEAGDDGRSNTLPPESIEKGSLASEYVDNPDKPDPASVAQIEKLPDEQ